VFILTPDKLPSYWNERRREWMRKAGDISQERNIEYVAVTRAKEELYFVWEDQPVRLLTDGELSEDDPEYLHSPRFWSEEEEWEEADDDDGT
jgi:superfamily I DNA/RNA helicase